MALSTDSANNRHLNHTSTGVQKTFRIKKTVIRMIRTIWVWMYHPITIIESCRRLLKHMARLPILIIWVNIIGGRVRTRSDLVGDFPFIIRVRPNYFRIERLLSTRGNIHYSMLRLPRSSFRFRWYPVMVHLSQRQALSEVGSSRTRFNKMKSD